MNDTYDFELSKPSNQNFSDFLLLLPLSNKQEQQKSSALWRAN